LNSSFHLAADELRRWAENSHNQKQMTAPKHSTFNPDDSLTQPEKDLLFEIQMHTLAYYSPGKDFPGFDYNAEVDRICSLFQDPKSSVTIQVHPDLLAKIRSLKND
jgi:hypothetical protein